MAEFKLTFHSKVYVPVRPCQEVAVCLTEAFAAETVSGYPVMFARVSNSGARYLGSGGQPFVPTFENPRDEYLFQYDLTIDDAQFSGDSPTCADIVELIPYACLIHTLIDALVALA